MKGSAELVDGRRPACTTTSRSTFRRRRISKSTTRSSSLFGSTSLTSELKDLRDFLFRGLMLESEARSFQAAGIQVGADIGQAEERLLSDAIAPFGVALRNRAIEMGRLYVVLHCFENSIRIFIRETLEEKDGPDWAEKLPAKVKKSPPRTARRSPSRTRGSKGRRVTYWATSTSAIWRPSSSRSGLILRTSSRRSTGSSSAWRRWKRRDTSSLTIGCYLPTEFQRLYMYIADWNRIIGL